jgi:hypothetical protein
MGVGEYSYRCSKDSKTDVNKSMSYLMGFSSKILTKGLVPDYLGKIEVIYHH